MYCEHCRKQAKHGAVAYRHPMLGNTLVHLRTTTKDNATGYSVDEKELLKLEFDRTFICDECLKATM